MPRLSDVTNQADPGPAARVPLAPGLRKPGRAAPALMLGTKLSSQTGSCGHCCFAADPAASRDDVGLLQ
jgi:hypothetical protein